MEPLTTVLYVLVAIVSFALIGLILIQPSKGGGFGASFGGVVGESVFGAYAGSHLTKLTVILTTVLFVLTLFLAALVGRSRKTMMEDLPPGAPAAVQSVGNAGMDAAADGTEADAGAQK